MGGASGYGVRASGYGVGASGYGSHVIIVSAQSKELGFWVFGRSPRRGDLVRV